MASIWSYEELEQWLSNEYPDLRLFRWRDGRWTIEQALEEITTIELGPPWEYDGIALKETGWQVVFEVKNRLVGGWVCDEIRKRDPRLAHNPGNLYHQAWKISKAAEAEGEQRNEYAQESAKASWDIVRRSPALLNRISAHMERGDTKAAMAELSLENLYRHAHKESPKELRSKDFWRNVNNG